MKPKSAAKVFIGGQPGKHEKTTTNLQAQKNEKHKNFKKQYLQFVNQFNAKKLGC